jgi:hypothetical protein
MPVFRIIVALVVIAFLITVLVDCGGPSGGGDRNEDQIKPETVDTSASDGPELRVVSVRDLGVIETSSTITARDGGYSVLHKRQSTWVYGDTILAFQNADNTRGLSNSWSTTHDEDAGDGIAGFQERVDQVGAPTAFFPFTDSEIDFNKVHEGADCIKKPCDCRWAIWPGAIIADPEEDLVYAFYEKVYYEEGDLNFHHVGHSVAVWKNYGESPERILFNRVENYPTLLFAENQPGFGSAAVVVDKTAYIYGCELDDRELTKPCHLARVPIANILDIDAWSYYLGNGNWSLDLNDSRAIFSGNNMMTIFFSPYIDRYIAVYSQPMDTKTMLRTARKPEGPWSSPLAVFTAEAPVDSHGWVYDALAHPEYSQDDGRIVYITYTRTTAPYHTEMKLVAIELERLL